MTKGDRHQPATSPQAADALTSALNAQRRGDLEAYARANGMSAAQALALAVDRLLASADTDDYLTDDDVPENLY